MRASSSGLEGVVVADTLLSDVDGAAGRLVLRGYLVEDLALTATFEDAVALYLDVTPDLARDRLAAARRAAWDARGPTAPATMDTLRAALAGGDAHDAEDVFEAIGLLPVALASAQALPPTSSSHARDLLRLVRGVEPTDAEVRALDTYLVTVVDHGMNASTFASRVVASTGSDLRSCLVAGVGALKGPLHGGAPGPVLDMLDAVATPDRAGAWIDAELDAGRRIMGMGHRIYRVRDPRAFVLERAIERLAEDVATRNVAASTPSTASTASTPSSSTPSSPSMPSTAAASRIALARAVEKAAERALAARHPERALKANVEFFTAVLLDAVGLPRTSFSSIFACSRIVGWCAHVREQRQVGKLIRPLSRYVGEIIRRPEESAPIP